MTDFFADLERQLVDATPRRAQRLRRARLRRAAAVSTILLALAAGGTGLAVAVGGNGGGTSAAGGGPAATAPATATQPTLPATPGAAHKRGSYTVAVLNGTTVPGLARGVANRLQNSKFKIGNVTNAPSQDHAQTQVFYARPDSIPAATDVAEAIGVRGGLALKPITKAQQVIAGDQATVIVIAGSDQNTGPQPR
jgi:hypothetical protein